MNDYSSWVHQATEFIQNLCSFTKPLGEVTADAVFAPRLTQQELEQLKSEVNKPIPNELCRFWLEGSRCCSWRYTIKRNVASYEENETLYGGTSFFEATELPSHMEVCLEWAEIVGDDDPKPMAFWRDSIPFSALDNGDYLGILITDDENKSPVVYLSHDDECRIISNSFSSFLTTWERLCYIGPEIWIIEEYLDDAGLLDADTQQAEELRDLLDESKPLTAPEAIEQIAPEVLQERRLSFLKQISMCAVMFISDEDGKLPDADNWQEQFQIYIPDIKRITNLPRNPASICTMNNQVSGVQQSTIVNPEKTVLFFESRLEGDSPHGNQNDVFHGEQRNRQVIFVLADSQVCIFDEAAQRELKWTVK